MTNTQTEESKVYNIRTPYSMSVMPLAIIPRYDYGDPYTYQLSASMSIHIQYEQFLKLNYNYRAH